MPGTHALLVYLSHHAQRIDVERVVGLPAERFDDDGTVGVLRFGFGGDYPAMRRAILRVEMGGWKAEVVAAE